MKCIRLVLLTTVLSLLWIGTANARAVRTWSYQELLDKADLVVIATATATKDTAEHIDLPGFAAQPVIGVETRFEVSVVLKGDTTLKDLVLHHYRADVLKAPNGPNLVTFDPTKQRAFLLFLVRETDGRYAPAFGQVDPGLCSIDALTKVGD